MQRAETRNHNCSNTLTSITLVHSDKSTHKVNLIKMNLKLRDSVSGFVSTGQLCEAVLLIAEKNWY